VSIAVVVGVGNRFRRDDGVGPAVAEDIARRNRVGVRVVTDIGDSTTLLDVWAGARLAVIVDGASGEGAAPGRIRRWAAGEGEPDLRAVSSHAMALPQAYALGATLGRIPDRLVVISIDIADAGYGIGLSPAVAAAVPHAAELVLDELGVQETSGEVGNGTAVHVDPRTAFSP
jgi:hydrogenase maturation protease